MTPNPLNTQFTPAAAPDQSAQFWAGFYDLLHEGAERCRAIMAENVKAAAPVSEADATARAGTAKTARQGDFITTARQTQAG